MAGLLPGALGLVGGDPITFGLVGYFRYAGDVVQIIRFPARPGCFYLVGRPGCYVRANDRLVADLLARPGAYRFKTERRGSIRARPGDFFEDVADPLAFLARMQVETTPDLLAVTARPGVFRVDARAPLLSVTARDEGP